mgnify:CR=1 FL=1
MSVLPTEWLIPITILTTRYALVCLMNSWCRRISAGCWVNAVPSGFFLPDGVIFLRQTRRVAEEILEQPPDQTVRLALFSLGGGVVIKPLKHKLVQVRMVERLENDGRGLNLTREVQNGILCHTEGEDTVRRGHWDSGRSRPRLSADSAAHWHKLCLSSISVCSLGVILFAPWERLSGKLGDATSGSGELRELGEEFRGFSI